MRRYLIRKYLVIMAVMTAGLSALPILLTGTTVREAFLQALFWSGLLAAIATHREFARRNVWPLYDNLRQSRYALLATLAAANALVSVLLRAWMN